MSAFLGPIHEKMYSRILYQDKLSKAILDLAAKDDLMDDSGKKIDETFPAGKAEPLENIIDPTNIHGWLNVAVQNCELRFATAASSVLNKNPGQMEALEGLMKKLGEERALQEGLDAESAFTAIHDILLDGMPCDFPFAVLESSPDEVLWQVTSCPHLPYWQKLGYESAEPYFKLRDAWISGILSKSGLVHSRNGLNNSIKRRA